jgi:Ca2+-binding EF-hand superfamily protein
MGCGATRPVTPVGAMRVGNALATKINAAIKLKMQQNQGKQPLTLEKIVLKMEQTKKVLGTVKKVFSAFSEDSGKSISKQGLISVMGRLHSELSDEEVGELFAFVDIDISHSIEFREFLVALCCSHVLGKLTAEKIAQSDSSPEAATKSNNSASWEASLAKYKVECIQMLDLILSAYLLFDPTGQGYITQNGVEKILEENSNGASGAQSNHYLSKQMWSQMDWNKDGSIDFGEFVLSFSKWTDFDDPDLDVLG